MKFYIGGVNGSGIEAYNFEDFVEYLRDMVETAKEQGEENFDINVETYLTGDSNDEAIDDDDLTEKQLKEVDKRRKECGCFERKDKDAYGNDGYCTCTEFHCNKCDCLKDCPLED